MATIENGDPNDVALSVQMAPAQAAAGFQLRDSTGDIKFSVDKDGNVVANAIQPFHTTTSYSSLQTAIDAVCPTEPVLAFPDAFMYDDGGVLFHPEVTWTFASGKLESHVHVPSFLTLVGSNSHKSVFNWHGDTGTQSALAFQARKFQIDSGAPILMASIRDLFLKGDYHTEKDCIGTDDSCFDYDYIGHTGLYYNAGSDIEVRNNRILEWGHDGVNILGTGPVAWWGRMRFADNAHYANKRWAYYFNADARLVDFSNLYVGSENIIISHSPDTWGTGTGHGGIAGSFWSAKIHGTCIEGMANNWLGDYSHSISINSGWDIQIFNHYEEANIYGVTANWVRGLRVSEVYHMSNQGFYFSNTVGAIIENNHFVYTADGIDPLQVTMYLAGDLYGCIVRNNFHDYATEPRGIKFLNITSEPDYIEQLKLTGTPYVGSSGRYIRGAFAPLQMKAGTPNDSDFEYMERTDPETDYTKHNSIGIQCMDTTTGDIWFRTAAGWRKTTPTT